jgi:fatty acid CoA ligase FadD9
VHGAATSVVHAGDLTLDKFIDAATIGRAGTLPPVGIEPRTVLVTGVTGYLGRYLALDWLERMASVGGTVTCLVRAVDDATARNRLDDTFDSGDDDLLVHYRSLAAHHLEVVAGDKSKADFGLDKATWQRLAETVDLIIDPAALVNHVLPYAQLFGPNVAGTAEMIRLALTTRIKPVAHVSSIAVGATVALGEFTEDADVRRMCSTRRLDDSYASGYATSKWASEVLLREAHDLCGLPVSVFRCDMLMADTTYRGQLNIPDMVTRLILSVAVTGLAPETFYIPDATGKRARAHFDGLPVDFVARSISALSIRNPVGFQTLHVVNPHDDGIGLDEYVDWMVEAGCQIERIHSYDEWYLRFESALRNLPDRQRQASLLPILASYRYPQPSLQGAFAPVQRFRNAVQGLDLAPNGDIPHIGKSTIEKYLTDLESLGLLSGLE